MQGRIYGIRGVLTPGKVIIPNGGITDQFGRLLPPQPLYIVREATREEYTNQGPLHQIASFPSTTHYYEVLTD